MNLIKIFIYSILMLILSSCASKESHREKQTSLDPLFAEGEMADQAERQTTIKKVRPPAQPPRNEGLGLMEIEKGCGGVQVNDIPGQMGDNCKSIYVLKLRLMCSDMENSSEPNKDFPPKRSITVTVVRSSDTPQELIKTTEFASNGILQVSSPLAESLINLENVVINLEVADYKTSLSKEEARRPVIIPLEVCNNKGQ